VLSQANSRTIELWLWASLAVVASAHYLMGRTGKPRWFIINVIMFGWAVSKARRERLYHRACWWMALMGGAGIVFVGLKVMDVVLRFLMELRVGDW